MMFEKLIIKHLANSLLKILPEEITSKISSLLGDLKKLTETGKKNPLSFQEVHRKFCLAFSCATNNQTAPFQGMKSDLRTKQT